MAHDLDAERKVNSLTEELKDLGREMRLKEQTIQEDAVKIELINKRMESVKRQADTSAELEEEVNRLRRKEKDSTTNIEQLQSELDKLEREHIKLKQTAPTEKAGEQNVRARGKRC